MGVLVFGVSLMIAFVPIAAGLSIGIVWQRYFARAQYEGVGKRFGLRRARWEPLGAWEDRIWAAQKEALDAADALTKEAMRLGSWAYFPPYRRPAVADSLTWTTGIEFRPGGIVPIIWWLDNAHPIAERFRRAHPVERHG